MGDSHFKPMSERDLSATGFSAMISILTSSPGTALADFIYHVILPLDRTEGVAAETGKEMHISAMSVLITRETRLLNCDFIIDYLLWDYLFFAANSMIIG